MRPQNSITFSLKIWRKSSETFYDSRDKARKTSVRRTRRTQATQAYWAAGDIEKPIQKTGSRYRDGNVPNVNFNDGEVNVNRVNPDNHNPNWRSRSEISIS